MASRYYEFAEFLSSFASYSDDCFTGEEFAKYADMVNVCKIEHFIYQNGVLIKSRFLFSPTTTVNRVMLKIHRMLTKTSNALSAYSLKPIHLHSANSRMSCSRFSLQASGFSCVQIHYRCLLQT